MQVVLDLFIFTDALHVLGGSSAHHQENNCTYVSMYCHPILLLAATVEKMEESSISSTVAVSSSIG
jgi:hypothetical protein